MAVKKTSRRGASKGRTVVAPAGRRKDRPDAATGCCPAAGDLVTLELGDPVLRDNPLYRGMRRIHPDGTMHPSEHLEPYGYVIPRRKVLVVTDLAYLSGFTRPRPAGTLASVNLGITTVSGEASTTITQNVLFTASALFSNNGAIGGNFPLRTGFAVGHGHYLTANFHDSDLVSTHCYVYGYLAPA
jgi:hypothetical protein